MNLRKSRYLILSVVLDLDIEELASSGRWCIFPLRGEKDHLLHPWHCFASGDHLLAKGLYGHYNKDKTTLEWALFLSRPQETASVMCMPSTYTSLGK